MCPVSVSLPLSLSQYRLKALCLCLSTSLILKNMVLYICSHTKVIGHNPAVEEAENGATARSQYLYCVPAKQVN